MLQKKNASTKKSGNPNFNIYEDWQEIDESRKQRNRCERGTKNKNIPLAGERRSNSVVNDSTSTKGRSDICRQIHRPGRSDRTSSSCFVVSDPTSIKDDRAFAIISTSWDDRAFVVRSVVLIEAFRHLRRTSLSAIQLLLGDDRTFAVRSTVLVGAIEHLCRDRAEVSSLSSFGEMEAKLYRHHLREEAKLHHRRHLEEAEAELCHRFRLRATTYWR
ncbi:hypothetical protein E5676_scaffold757G00200 [Cucumis melo var. makuwa]|uniref:Uncharacterized protein n=1 Tax=Cucumis melo var. makuwa TaxID=1194695 RepID=A0A5D3CGV9_CUCMM|nr:hypothetical protein E5676_scaffold757G00200 [Cucumis melo var. makuwa]